MMSRSFLDPLGSKLPALERNILKLRAMQMVLVLFYAERLKQEVIDLIQGTDDLNARFQPHEPARRVPKGVKNPVAKALDALLADGAITADDRAEIVRLIDYRNLVGHDVHDLVADVSTERYVRQFAAVMPDRLTKYDYEAVDRLRYFRSLLSNLYRTHHYVMTVRSDDLLFKSAERTFLSEIRTLNRKINRLYDNRRTKVRALNAELKLVPPSSAEEYPDHPWNRYANGRLTRRGEEILYRLFDQKKTPMAAAHLTGLSLRAARERKRRWLSLGGIDRPKVDLKSLPRRKFHRRVDDD